MFNPPDTAMRPLLPLLLLSLPLLAQTAQAGPLLDRLIPSAHAESLRQPDDARILRDLAYGSDPAQKLDVYLPARRQRAPILLMVHGGAWRTGDKAHGRVVENKVRHWLPQGFVFISVNYRMLPAADPLTQADDVARALAWVQRHAAEWNADADQVVLMGHSAGAHLVALLSANPARAEALGARPWYGAVVLDSAVMDTPALMSRPHMPFYDAAFGSDPAYWREASPLHQLTAAAPPLLLVCSTQRRDKPCLQAEGLAAAAHHLGLQADVLPQDLKHGEINSQLGLPGAYTDTVDRFIRDVLGR